ncbi:alpha-1,2-mannosyltransferase [Trypanosoma grayi]|uniref:alpha-1,2-mannosyltransferase n=1 Tax=Trypanosoma grayi TaxID=71804 RepID=UPI0004F41D0E|nr:alpha-1,2-mannosyltransferase [Trypanosoma grayi]KEG07274.1 alpha-1,2-mannosyltransferase [Trypanosoma grayi]
MAFLPKRFVVRLFFLLLLALVLVHLGLWLCFDSNPSVRTVGPWEVNLVHAGCQREGPETSAVNGVILILIGDAGNRFAGDMLPRLEAYFLSRYRYPVHIFYETLPESMQVAIERAIPSATRVEFEDVSRMWQALPRGVTEEMLEAWMNTREQLRQKKRGYRIMCRFWAGLVWQLPSLDRYEYYWRLDDDSFLTAPLPCDVFQVMQARQCVYGYRLILKEGREVTVDIWPTFLRWAETKLSVADISEISDMFVTGNETLGKKKFRSFMYYNNFELGTIALKRHPLYRSMFRFMDEEEPHGIMRYRWGDAPVHTLGVEVVLHREGWKKCQFSPSLGGYIHTKDPRLPPLPTSRPT